MPTGFDLNTMTFTITDVEMTKADFKFRYSGGWKVELDPDFDLGDGNSGIKVNCNFGTAVDNLVPGVITSHSMFLVFIQLLWFGL